MTKMILFFTALIGLGCAQAIKGKQEITPGEKRATLAVTWYDVGKQALDGLPGVRSVTTGWKGNYEVNEVVYDPKTVDVAKLEEELRRAGTYLKTLEP